MPRRLLLSLLLLASLGCRPAPEADPVILEWQGQLVRRSDFERYLAAVEVSGGVPIAPEARRSLLDTFLEERVLALQARALGRLGPDASPEEEQRAVHRLLSEAAAGIEVSEAEVEAYYHAHLDELSEPETVTVRQVLVPTLNEARDVRRRLLRRPRSFEVVARQLSHGPEATKGGLMGTFARGQLPKELEAAAFALAPGGTSSIVQTSLGYHVLRLDARQPARQPSIEESRARIHVLLSRQAADRKVREYVTGLLARARVNHAAAWRRSAPP